MSDAAANHPIRSVTVFCGSNVGADPAYRAATVAFGELLVERGIGLVYGGGAVGLMGVIADTVLAGGGSVTGIIPQHLWDKEVGHAGLTELLVVDSMHERKMMMFERSDGFVVLPGGIGTLEEVVELLSWRRLDLHGKPVVFYNPGGFWEPLFKLFQHTVDHQLTPASFMDTWTSVSRIEDIVPALLHAQPAGEDAAPDAARMT